MREERGKGKEGVGMGMCDPDDIGVRSGVTTVADCGSVGVANLGVFPAHILPAPHRVPQRPQLLDHRVRHRRRHGDRPVRLGMDAPGVYRRLWPK